MQKALFAFETGGIIKVNGMRKMCSMEPAKLDMIRQEAIQLINQGKRKHRLAPPSDGQRKRQRVVSDTSLNTSNETKVQLSSYIDVPDSRIEEIINNNFLRTPTKEERDNRVVRFIEATGNEAMEGRTCGSCMHDRPNASLVDTKIVDIPNKDWLKPHTPHPAQVLTKELLLYRGSVTEDNESVSVCIECMNSLKKKKRPKFSLANDLWLGDIPKELQGLTLPESVLISKHFTAAYIVKLFPKQKGSHTWDRARMHNGLRGNVSTYCLDPKQVVSMVNPKVYVYPPSPKVLSATIAVTFLGPKGLTEASMPSMFCVQWRMVK